MGNHSIKLCVYWCRHSHRTARFDPNIFGGGLINYGDKTASRRGIRLLLSRLFERGFRSDQLRAYDVPEKGEELER
jgi:hypothetical protein